jgi:WD40-like Beta Propeller Repeat
MRKLAILALLCLTCSSPKRSVIVVSLSYDATVTTPELIKNLQVTLAGVVRNYPVPGSAPFTSCTLAAIPACTLAIDTDRPGQLTVSVAGTSDILPGGYTIFGTGSGSVMADPSKVQTLPIQLSCASGGCGTVAGTDGGAGGGGAAGTAGSAGAGGAAGTGTAGAAGAAGTLGAAGTGGRGGTTGAAGSSGTTGTGGAGTGGSGGASAACDVTRPFGTPVFVTSLNGPTGTDDGTARLSADELTVYFYSDRAGYQIFTATRTSRTDAFSTPQAIAGTGITSGGGGVFKFPTLTANALTIFFESDPGGTFTVMGATRTTVASQFTVSAPVANINASPDASEPFVLPDGSAIYFMSTRNNAAGTANIYRAARDASGQFTTPIQVSTFFTPPSSAMAPVVTPDDLVLYFASDRTPSSGNLDIWMTKRASPGASFDPPVNVQELNTAGNEMPNWISPDRCRIYLHRSSSGTNDKIYVAERAP